MAGKRPPGTPRKGARVDRPRGRPAWADDFIRELRGNGGNVTNAAPAAGISVRAAYDFRYEDAEFEAQWLEAVELGSKEVLEEMAVSAQERAARGWLEPVYFNGTLVGSKRRFDNDLAWKFLRAAFPSKYNVPSHIQVTEGDLSEILQTMALAVAQECPPELAQRIFDAWERDAFSKLRAGTRNGIARTVEAEQEERPSLSE